MARALAFYPPTTVPSPPPQSVAAGGGNRTYAHCLRLPAVALWVPSYDWGFCVLPVLSPGVCVCP